MGQSKNERMLELVELLNKASRSYYQECAGDHEQLRI